ncbi:hypothetical protein [Streptococcus thermophilus]|uniref:hypothetical protein n=1 Tax=Streptococcus thermophilus TaxID=1308 RepID=UPI001CF0286B|nr:hypothetical protein [Streptococcus thermophilus]MCA6643261.1 hypothetical protein [Streptococcus thermophilus]
MFFWFCLISTVILAYLIGNNSLKSNKWNYGLLLCLLADMYYVGLYLFKNIPTYIQGIVTYLKNMTSSLDAVILVALITGSITLLNSFYSRYSEQRNKKREYLATKREGPYSDLFTVIHKVSLSEKGVFVYSNEEMIKDINDFNSKLSLWGSPKVVKKWNDFRQKSLEGNKQLEPKELLNAVEEVMNEMRKDLGSKSTKKGELLSIFINDSENLLGKRK